MARKMLIKMTCCGDCPFYNHSKHKCNKGAIKEDDPKSPFFDDCPFEYVEWRDE